MGIEDKRMKQLFLDIETIPDNLESMPTSDDLEFYVEAEDPKPPGNYKSQEAVDKWLETKYPELVKKAQDKANEASTKLYEDSYTKWSKQSFDQINCRIITLSFAIDDDEPTTLSGSEKDIVRV